MARRVKYKNVLHKTSLVAISGKIYLTVTIIYNVIQKSTS